MANDSEAYVNRRIPAQLMKGILIGQNGDTHWSDFDLKGSIGSASFSWTMDNFDLETQTATVTVTISDTFDFNDGEGVGDGLSE